MSACCPIILVCRCYTCRSQSAPRTYGPRDFDFPFCLSTHDQNHQNACPNAEVTQRPVNSSYEHRAALHLYSAVSPANITHQTSCRQRLSVGIAKRFFPRTSSLPHTENHRKVCILSNMILDKMSCPSKSSMKYKIKITLGLLRRICLCKCVS